MRGPSAPAAAGTLCTARHLSQYRRPLGGSAAGTASDSSHSSGFRSSGMSSSVPASSPQWRLRRAAQSGCCRPRWMSSGLQNTCSRQPSQLPSRKGCGDARTVSPRRRITCTSVPTAPTGPFGSSTRARRSSALRNRLCVPGQTNRQGSPESISAVCHFRPAGGWWPRCFAASRMASSRSSSTSSVCVVPRKP